MFRGDDWSKHPDWWGEIQVGNIRNDVPLAYLRVRIAIKVGRINFHSLA